MSLIEITTVCFDGCCVAVIDPEMPPPRNRQGMRMLEEVSLEAWGPAYRWMPNDPYIEPPRTVK